MSRAVHRERADRGFTLVELTLVIIIILILVAIAIPAYGSLTYSSGRSGSASAVQNALESARDAAVRAGPGRDAAAIFLGGEDGRVRAVTGVVEAQILDDAGGVDVLRDIFVPAPGTEAIQLPRGWSARGYARAATLVSSVSGTPGTRPELADNAEWYEQTYTSDREDGHWVYPETEFYERAEPDSGAARQTFMVRFEGGTGRYQSTATAKALYIEPAPTIAFRRSGTIYDRFRVDRAEDLGRFVRRVLADPSLSQNDRRDLLGDISADTVLVGPVGQVAVYKEERLANSIGADGLNRGTDTFYRAIDGSVTDPEYDVGLFGGVADPAIINARISQWIRGSSLTTGALPASETSDARIFQVSRYLGSPTEVERLVEGQ
ncbi:MAG: prepilin-type N-terminal cleavage/methylation domain-containing protein [Planctomycetota bacterium]